jgi:hypothetical protein
MKRSRPSTGVGEFGRALPDKDPREEQCKHPQYNVDRDLSPICHRLLLEDIQLEEASIRQIFTSLMALVSRRSVC